MDWVDKPQNYKDLYRILQLLRGFHLNNFPLKTLKLGWEAFHSVTFQLKCLDFQSTQYKKLVPVLSRFCNWLFGRVQVSPKVKIFPDGPAGTWLFWTSSCMSITRTIAFVYKQVLSLVTDWLCSYKYTGVRCSLSANFAEQSVILPSSHIDYTKELRRAAWVV